MAKTTQISAQLSGPTRALLERYVRATGVKKQHLIEQALLHHLQALQELPTDVIMAARLVVSRDAGDQILERIETPRRPSRGLRDLMATDGD